MIGIALSEIVYFTLTEPDTEFRGQGEITLAVDPSTAAEDYTLYVGGSSLENGTWTARLTGHISAADKLTTRWGALKQTLH